MYIYIYIESDFRNSGQSNETQKPVKKILT